jgi:hypothetical protein
MVHLLLSLASWSASSSRFAVKLKNEPWSPLAPQQAGKPQDMEGRMSNAETKTSRNPVLHSIFLVRHSFFGQRIGCGP